MPPLWSLRNLTILHNEKWFDEPFSFSACKRPLPVSALTNHRGPAILQGAPSDGENKGREYKVVEGPIDNTLVEELAVSTDYPGVYILVDFFRVLYLFPYPPMSGFI